MITKCAGCGKSLESDKEYLEHICMCDKFLDYLTITSPERQSLVHDEVFDVVVDFFSTSSSVDNENFEEFLENF